MPSTSKSEICPLCLSEAKWYCDYFNEVVEFFRCKNCSSIFKSPDYFPDIKFEKERYETHNNDIYDKRYQKFVSPITNKIKEDFKNTSLGLDYGCGTGPVATYVLEKEGYKLKLYDPFFHPHESVLKENYDFIICCEVMEHFFYPEKEFKKLRGLLKTNSKLYCKTKMISEEMTVNDFKEWHYKNDPTHVFFYTSMSLDKICEIAGFKSVNFNDNLIIFST